MHSSWSAVITTAKNQIKKQVNQSFIELTEAAKSLDFERYLNFFDCQKFTSLSADGTVTGNIEGIEKIYRPKFEMLEKYHWLIFERVNIRVINLSTAILTNEYRTKVELKSGEIVSTAGAGTQVWVLYNDQWRLVSRSSSIKH